MNPYSYQSLVIRSNLVNRLLGNSVKYLVYVLKQSQLDVTPGRSDHLAHVKAIVATTITKPLLFLTPHTYHNTRQGELPACLEGSPAPKECQQKLPKMPLPSYMRHVGRCVDVSQGRLGSNWRRAWLSWEFPLG